MEYIQELQELHKKNNLVPFVGSGLSQPFNIPTWPGLVRKLSESVEKNLLPSIEFYLKQNELLKAIELLKDFRRYDELELQEKVALLIKQVERKPENSDEQIYSLLAKMAFQLYVTTNYDNWINNYINSINVYPINLYNYHNDISHLLNPPEKSVVHLHGNLKDHTSMVFSEESYNNRYKDKRYSKLFEVISNSKTFLFMGFSFDDWYIKNLFKNYNEYFKKPHYILLDSPTEKIYSELKENYRLRVIAYDSKKSSHANEIRKILNEIEPNTTVTSLNDLKETKVGNWIRINPRINDWLASIKNGNNKKAIYEHISKKSYFSIKENEYICIYTTEGVHILGIVDFHKELTIEELLNYGTYMNIGFTRNELIKFVNDNSDKIGDKILCTAFTIIQNHLAPIDIDTYSQTHEIPLPVGPYPISSFNK